MDMTTEVLEPYGYLHVSYSWLQFVCDRFFLLRLLDIGVAYVRQQLGPTSLEVWVLIGFVHAQFTHGEASFELVVEELAVE